MKTIFITLTALFLMMFLLINGIYLIGGVFAARNLARFGRQFKRSTAAEVFSSPLTPGVSILVPAHNEGQGLIESVWSLLALRYPQFEVIIVDNGSTDDTVPLMIAEFTMVPVRRALRTTVPAAEVQASYCSSRYPNLWLLHKDLPSKGDALNTGINAAKYPYIMSVDADGLLEENALLGAAQLIFENPDLVIGSCGILRPSNGSEIERGRVRRVGLPTGVIAGIQIVEYLRTFLVMRMFWTGINVLMIVSGAFGLFRRSTVEQVGGWYSETAAEDMELVMNLHRRMRERHIPYRIALVPEPVCWTEVPATLRDLLRQRRRWHRGTAEAVWRHRHVVFRRRYGRLGFFGIPLMMIELIGPIVELAAWSLVALAWALGELPTTVFLVFLSVSLLINLTLSLMSLSLAQVTYRRGTPPWETVRLVLFAIAEVLGYRQIVSFWCGLGLIDFIRGKHTYQQPTRGGASRSGAAQRPA